MKKIPNCSNTNYMREKKKNITQCEVIDKKTQGQDNLRGKENLTKIWRNNTIILYL